jgi:hypothetical protein
MIVAQLDKFSAFFGTPEVHYRSHKSLTTGFYPEPDKRSPCPAHHCILFKSQRPLNRWKDRLLKLPLGRTELTSKWTADKRIWMSPEWSFCGAIQDRCKAYFSFLTDYSNRRYSDWLEAGRPKGRSSSLGRGKNYLFSTSSKTGSGVHPTSSPVSTGGKAAEVKKMWIHTSTPPHAFMA